MKWLLHIVTLLGIGALIWGARATESATETGVYPVKPIKLVVPFNPGGGSDTFARVIKAGIDDNNLLPQPLVIINRPGGSSTIGSRYVRDAKPDGYTLLMLHDALITAKYSGLVPYGPESYEPVAGTGEIGLVVAVPESSPYQTLNDLLEAAKATPEEIVYGVNLGAPSHFLALRLEHAFPGAKFRYTQSGDGTDRVHNLVGGHIQAATFSATEYLSFREQGVRGLAIFGEERRASIPDLPTAVEQGIDVVEVNMQYWWFQKGTPPEHVQYIGEVLGRAMQTDTVREKLETLQMAPNFLTGDEFRTFLDGRIAAAESVGQQDDPDVPDVPLLVGVALAVCFVVMLIRGDQSSTKARLPETASGPAIRALVLCLVTVAYAASLNYGAPFAWATSSFVLAAGLTLTADRKRIAIPLLETALLVAFGIEFVLTRIVVTDLP